MFQPFGELKKKQCLLKVKDYGIGIGLSNSREIARFIDGDFIEVALQCTK
jgi:hypothetical protein